MIRCRDCDEQIGFIRLRSGRSCPVESDEPEEYRVHLEDVTAVLVTGQVKRLRLVTESGDVLTVYQPLSQESGRPRALEGPCRLVGYEVHECQGRPA